MATVSPRVASIVAHLPGVKASVQAEGKEVQARAKALFASHNRPGGHSVGGVRQDTDYLVYLSGPVPIVIEFGREGFMQDRPDGTKQWVGPMRGLHILGKAAGI